MAKRVAQVGVSTKAAMKVTGASKGTLENWIARDFLAPSIEPSPGTGRSRLYSFVDLVAIRICLALIKGGVEPRSLRQVVAYLRKRKGELSTSAVLASTMLVAADDGDVYEVDGGMALSALIKPGQRAMFMAVPLDTMVAEVQAKADRVMREEEAA